MDGDKGLLLVVSGPSGAGKSTVCKALAQRSPSMALSISVTTRLPRGDERDGVDYFFKTSEEFDQYVRQDKLLEYAPVYGNYYGTPKDHVMQCMERGQDVLLEIEMQGAMQVKRRFSQGIFIFVVPPTLEELKKRIVGRGSENPDTLMHRFSSACKEMSYMGEYNYIVLNDTLDQAVGDIEAIMRAERCRMDRKLYLRDELIRESAEMYES